jgi:hypothetical protein
VGKGSCRVGRGPAGSETCKTNPIWPGRVANAQNKAKLGPHGVVRQRLPCRPGLGRGVKRAKRTQFLDCGLRIERTRSGASARGEMRKTNPISGRRARCRAGTPNLRRGETCKTNPIWPGRGRAPEAKCTKRTQFPRVGRWVESPLFHYSIIPPFQSNAVRAKRTQFGPAGVPAGG